MVRNWRSGKDVEVRSSNGFAGVFAAKSYVMGEALLPLDGKLIEQPSKYSVQVAVDRHMEPNNAANGAAPWRLLNHSCAPNLEIEPAKKSFRAVREIARGEELTFNYLTTEWDMASPFECHCDNPGCHGTIRGFKHLSRDDQERLLARAAPHIRTLYRKTQESDSVGG